MIFAESATNVSFGGIARYLCYEGFSFASGNAKEEIRCNINGNWSHAPSCKSAMCPALTPSANGDPRLEFGDGTGYGTVFRFDCHQGLARRHCHIASQMNRQWSFEQPKCLSYRPFPSSTIQCALGAACMLSEDVGISFGFIPDGAFADNSDSTNWGYEPHKVWK
ncbi:unnamed protein product [Cylicocyclus nassatus]|uniref:Sushi domain-containing protein n=1 Tax=Cylicocyclus nassatus TaxID=53992 RepID=A0AA36H364_CYLNA|nr:unnamed protein product [Cylicocyclus nassatus]